MKAGWTALPSLALTAAFVLARPASGAEFSVSPIRIEFDRTTRTSSVNVRNDGDRPLRAQVTLSEWSQDGDGRDVYSDSKDLVFFPKILSVEPGAEAVVRIGVRSLPASVEKTYRLYVEEMPEPSPEGGARVNVRVRFGVGVFVQPPVKSTRAEIVALDVRDGTVHVPVRNTGSVSFRVDKVLLCGTRASGEPLSREIGGWYVLAGATRPFQARLTEEECRGLVRIDVAAVGADLKQEAGLDVPDGACAR
ncbi:MAG TPA: fimbria/pilus periplasmic chaperone [Thermoanaerobaculia bacterium]|nr:fimbria/pilus periplasmic chaperone [Thermoanaerobaculia bacterium]HQN07039.1 fimbria/pilus periplasmic chaperone [Thermoanaerobaculia bacterium]HQP87018.1 fimbria/pilus periplasmic chaperone [Thermoanaerobaculia bacterium]